ncbi:MAG: DNA-processing protein DprA, partial [Nitrosopumilus sp.]
MKKKFKSFEDLKAAMESQQKLDFQEHYQSNDFDNAFESIKSYSIREQQQFLFKKDIAIVYYEKFKLEFSNQDFEQANNYLNHAYDLDPHNELYLKRRKLFNDRKSNSQYVIEKAERNLLEQPKRREPNFQYINKSYSIGVYKWKGDSDRSGHTWSNLITDFKAGDSKLSHSLGMLLGDFVLKRTDLVEKCDIIVPVASDPYRSYKRGFEITQILAEGVSQIVAMHIVGTYLVRSSTDHARNLRKYELVSSYFSKPEKAKQIEGKTILLIDDICTSGRTLETCAKILIDGGASVVYSAVLARAESTQKRIKAGSIMSTQGDCRTKRLAAWYRLIKSEKLGPIRIQKLIEKYNTPENVLSQSIDELKTNKGIGEKVAQGIIAQNKAEEDYHSVAIEQFEKAERIRSQIIDINNPYYPDILYKSKMPSPVIHIRGKKDILTGIDKSIAIVGSRNITDESIEFIKNIIPELVRDEWIIISGLALGVDATTHTVCLDNNGQTIGVLGNGVDVIYPKENSNLFNRMIKKGVLLSEFNLGSSVSEIKLIRRNKIIAGLSNVVFVVQTMPKGGAMNAVRAAIENTRPVITWNSDRILKDEKYSGNKDIIEKKLGYGVNS